MMVEQAEEDVQVTIEVVLDGEMMGVDKEVNRKVDGEVDELLEVV